MSAQIIDMARYRADSERAAIRRVYEGDPRWRQRRLSLAELLGWPRNGGAA